MTNEGGLTGHALTESQQSLLELQQTREPIAREVADQKAASISRVEGNALRKASDLLNQAHRANRVGKRISLVLEATDAWVEPWAAVSACRKGCNHCCSLPSIVITSAEARRLSRISGRTMQSDVSGVVPIASLTTPEGQAHARQLDAGNGYSDVPCPFLESGECSVYEDRPLVCRTHVNLDDSPLLCERVPGHAVEVPFLDSREIWAASLMLQPGESIADIRAFFPKTVQNHGCLATDTRLAGVSETVEAVDVSDGRPAAR